MKCKFCKKEFVSKRKTAKYCSDKCRVYSHRKRSEDQETKMPKTWTDKYKQNANTNDNDLSFGSLSRNAIYDEK